MNVKKMTVLAVFTSIALTIFMLESLIPPPLPIQGMKLGLANIVTLYLLCIFSEKEALLVLVLRILLGSMFAGQMMSLAYSLAGGMLSFAVAAILIRLFHKKWLWMVGMASGICHNIGQIAVAWLVLQSPGVLAYFPVLVLSGTAAGLFTGLVAGFLFRSPVGQNLRNHF